MRLRENDPSLPESVCALAIDEGADPFTCFLPEPEADPWTAAVFRVWDMSGFAVEHSIVNGKPQDIALDRLRPVADALGLPWDHPLLEALTILRGSWLLYLANLPDSD